MSSWTNLKWLPNPASIHDYPALTVGLSLFTFILLIVDVASENALSHKFSLYPEALGELDLNRVSFYPLFHSGLFHWFLNVLTLFQPLAIFEKTHGTVYTGITLNLLAVLTALQYCIAGYWLYPGTHAIGLSALVFSFLAWLAYKEHFVRPNIVLYRQEGSEIKLPTLFAPVAYLFISMILLPGSSFWGHLAGLFAGYFMALDYMKVLYPPAKVILWIEKKVDPLIQCLQGVVVYYKEEDATHVRSAGYTPISTVDVESSVSVVAEASASASEFHGEGHVLGA
ncbi:Rhomboid family proteins Function unknown [Scheffersomyces stipitis CBS 6054]|uniref:Rhomboid-type serine protease 2 n=1 Tax=Scheffersomyces stipitis (strain ATCC 58785 / CBS 6054 / NBRC 10063 / NRRL Y-11545) TaxID=322104 RepID=A3LPD2_PICST|nr:Rhomboid family proteins Function unknown [Scheffersomyces stipitis CBS 6054]ABN65024.2 Rhomboid family proteins Function unknown [Scheffersomyces stipitis CBS 6054]KAG2736614.1 hypothetical protein G9P44_000704 [Scheffersomyces stipitis]